MPFSNFNCEILSLASPNIDVIIPISEEIFSKIPGARGGMESITYKQFLRILNLCPAPARIVPGGSGANTLRGLAHFGYKCSALGTIGNDEFGVLFKRNLLSHKITPLYGTSQTPTGRVLSLVTPDGERTMRSFLGAGQEFSSDEMSEETFKGIKLVHIEGYSFLRSETALKAMQFAKKHGALVSLDLGSFELAAQYKELLIQCISQYVDLVFGNIREIEVLTGKNPEKGSELLRDLCENVVALMGANGSLIRSGEKKIHVPAIPATPIDTTGAGDLYISGFLHGFLSGKPLETAGYYGTVLANAVIQVLGPEILPDQWDAIDHSLVTSPGAV